MCVCVLLPCVVSACLESISSFLLLLLALRGALRCCFRPPFLSVCVLCACVLFLCRVKFLRLFAQFSPSFSLRFLSVTRSPLPLTHLFDSSHNIICSLSLSLFSLSLFAVCCALFTHVSLFVVFTFFCWSFFFNDRFRFTS